MNYGEEGVSYTMVDGEPQFTDLVLHNPDGLECSHRATSTKYRSCVSSILNAPFVHMIPCQTGFRKIIIP